MSESAKAQDAFRPEASIPEGAVPLELILCTEELHRRPSRPPDPFEQRAADQYGHATAVFPEVAFVLDLTVQKHAEAALRLTQEDLRKTQPEFAHVNRVMTMASLLPRSLMR